MDTLYIGDIPNTYHYAIFNNGFIDLYNTPQLHNNTYTRYRIYTNVNGFYYSMDSIQVGSYTTNYATDIKVTDNICYRQDFNAIVVTTFIIALFGIWLCNLFTSMIRKGGVLGGLL